MLFKGVLFLKLIIFIFLCRNFTPQFKQNHTTKMYKKTAIHDNFIMKILIYIHYYFLNKCITKSYKF